MDAPSDPVRPTHYPFGERPEPVPVEWHLDAVSIPTNRDRLYALICGASAFGLSQAKIAVEAGVYRRL